MSDHIPFDIQSDIIKRLPVKSLLQFRSVSKQWKSFIESPSFIKNYHINHTNPQHHLLVRFNLENVQTYTTIVDNSTFPQQMFSLTIPESLYSLRNIFTLSSVDGLVYFCGDVNQSTRMAIIWNPSIRKSVCTTIPTPKSGYIVVGFGVCPDTNGPKLVKITLDTLATMSWMVEVFTLSTRVWKNVYIGAPFKSCDLLWIQVFVDGVIYFCAYDDLCLNPGVRSNSVISFDLRSEKFGEVCLPERLVHTPYIDLAKVNESLGLLEYYDDGGMRVCGVWMRKDGASKPFNKIYTVKVGGNSFLRRVLEFRNNGEVVIAVDDDNNEESRIKAYEPLSGHINDVGIHGKQRWLYVSSYMETLLLLDEKVLRSSRRHHISPYY